MDYIKQAKDFCEKTGTEIRADFQRRAPFFAGETETRNIYSVSITRHGQGTGKQMTFPFGQSIANTLKNIGPSRYDILACLTKYNPGTFENFCAEYGYDTDSRKADETYKNILAEWVWVENLFGDVLDELREIQ